MKMYKPEMMIGISNSENGLPQVTIQVSGAGRAAICMTSKSARIYADGLCRAADKLDEMLARKL